MEKMPIGAYIKQQREAKGWSQEFLCEGVCSRTTLSRIENDSQAPSFTTLNKLFEKLGLPSRQFLMLTDMLSIEADNLQKKIRNNSVLCQETEGEERARLLEQFQKDLERLETLCGKDNPLFRQFALSTQVTAGRPDGPYSSEERLDMLLSDVKLSNYKERTAQVMAFLDKYIPDVAAMETQMKKYHKCFTTAEAEKAVLKAENESLTDKLEKSQQQSTLKKLQDAKLQSDYEAAQAVLERIPPDIIKAYTQRGNRERKVDQYSALE